MPEIRNFTMNFGSGPLDGPALTLDLRKRKSACAEIHPGEIPDA